VVDAVLVSAMSPLSLGLRHKVAEGQRHFEGIAAAVVCYQPCEPDTPLFNEASLFQEQAAQDPE